MNNFIYENRTKVYFGQGCVKEFLACLVRDAGNIMLAYGQGSVKRNGIYDEVLNILMKEGKHVTEFPGIMPNPTYQKAMEGARLAREEKTEMILGVIVTAAGTGSECNGAAVITNEEQKVKTGHDYPKCNPVFALMDPAYTFSVPGGQMVSGAFDSLSHMMETYFSEPDEQNVSDEISEALMRSVIKNIRQAVRDPKDYAARSNLLWNSALSENRLIKLGKRCDFACHLMEHQLSAYTGCSHSQGMAVLQPVYYRHIYRDGLDKFARFAENVWMIPGEGRSREELAEAGVHALADLIRETGLPARLREIGIKGQGQLKEIADSCHYSPGAYRKLGAEEILEIFRECF